MATPLLVVLNGMCPYLGLKTDSSFAMFSNLRTEPGFANHLVMPHGPQPFGFQGDLVRLVVVARDVLPLEHATAALVGADAGHDVGLEVGFVTHLFLAFLGAAYPSTSATCSTPTTRMLSTRW